MSLGSLVYAVLDASQVWRLFRWVNRGKLKILMYHGVTDQSVLSWTQIDVAAFERQMSYLRQAYEPVSLSEAVEMLSGRRPMLSHAVVVTFDDGFKNNVTAAYPILEKYKIPATVFVTTGFIDRQTPHAGLLWVDYIYAILDGTECHEVDLSELGLGHFDLSTPQARAEAKARICHQLKQRDYREKNRLIEAIRNRVGERVRPEVYAAMAPMTWQDIERLDSERLVNFGAHTVTHEILSRLPHEVAASEILESQQTLQKRLGKPVPYFAYPNGMRDDFTEQAKELVAQHFVCGLTTVAGQNQPGQDLFLLRRIAVGRDTTFSLFRLSLSGITEFIHRVRRTFGRNRVGSY